MKAAGLRPVDQDALAAAESEESVDEILAEIDRIAELIGKDWPEGVSAAEAVAEQRRRPMYGDP